LVQLPSHDLLAGAAISPNQYRDVGVGHLFDDLSNFPHLLTVAGQHHVLGFRPGPAAQPVHFLFQCPLFQRLSKREFEFLHFERLAQEI